MTRANQFHLKNENWRQQRLPELPPSQPCSLKVSLCEVQLSRNYPRYFLKQPFSQSQSQSSSWLSRPALEQSSQGPSAISCRRPVPDGCSVGPPTMVRMMRKMMKFKIFLFVATSCRLHCRSLIAFRLPFQWSNWNHNKCIVIVIITIITWKTVMSSWNSSIVLARFCSNMNLCARPSKCMIRLKKKLHL